MRRLINNGTVTDRDFLAWRDAVQLTAGGLPGVFDAYDTRKATVVMHPLCGYEVSYGRMNEVQARTLAACVRGDALGYPGFTDR